MFFGTNLRARSATWVSRRLFASSEAVGEEIILFGDKAGRSFGKTIGSIIFPPMIILPSMGYLMYDKGLQFEESWKKYSMVGGGVTLGILGALCFPLWRNISRLLRNEFTFCHSHAASRLTLEVESGMLRLERPTSWWPWRTTTYRFPLKGVLPGVKAITGRNGEFMAERMIIQLDSRTQMFIFRGPFPNRELFDQIKAGTYTRAAVPETPPGAFS